MKSGIASALTAVVVCVAPLSAQTTAPPAEQGLTPPGAGVYKLTVNVKPMDVFAYKTTSTIDGAVTMPGSTQSMPVNVTMSFINKTIIDKVNPDGNYAVRYKVGAMKMTMNGVDFPVPKETGTMELKATMSKEGKVSNVQGLEALAGNGGMMSVDPATTVNSMIRNNVIFPPEGAKVGDVWTTEVPMPYDASGKSVIKQTNTLTEVSTANGKTIATVLSTMEGPLTINLTQPMPMSMTGTIKGTTTNRINLGTGQISDSNGNVDMQMKMQMPNPAGNGEQMNMDMSMNVATKMTPVAANTPMEVAKPAPAKPAPAKPAPKKPVSTKK
ncbi:MAG: hypothetical protein GYA63_06875 [Armatimonadetes bacterium]|jgi:hypothetical protein|nr:hypothetical protein [Armatimonadota bacterium]HOC30642.1 hypothetical protein [Armatimonadota bacterium]